MQRLRASAAGPNLLPCAVPSSSPPRSWPPSSPLRRRPRRAAPSSWRRRAQAFSVSPASIAPGATLTIGYRIGGRPRRVRVRVDLLPGGRRTARGDAAPGPAAHRPQPDGDVAAGAGSRPLHRPPARDDPQPRRGARTSQQLGAGDRGAAGDRRRPASSPCRARTRSAAQEARFGAGRDRPHAPGPGHPRRGRHAGRGPARRLRLLARLPEGRRRPLRRAPRRRRARLRVHAPASTARSLVQKGQARRGRAAARRRRLDRRAPTGRTCTSRSGPTAGTRARPRSRSTRCPTCSPGPRSLEGVDDQVLAFRLAAQGLNERDRTPAEVAASFALQDSPPGAALTALNARSDDAGAARRAARRARARRPAQPADGGGHPARGRRRRLPRGAQAARRAGAQGRAPERRARRLRGRPRARGDRRSRRRSTGASSAATRCTRTCAAGCPRSCCPGARAARATTPAAAC